MLKKKYKYNEFKKMLVTPKIMDFKEDENPRKKTIMEKFPPGSNIGSIS